LNVILCIVIEVKVMWK